jgi:hypothetical protein
MLGVFGTAVLVVGAILFACIQDPTACYAYDSCCSEAGGDGEYCYDDGTCNAGHVCVTNPGFACPGLSECCVPAGASGEACHADGTCDDGLFCIDDSL